MGISTVVLNILDTFGGKLAMTVLMLNNTRTVYAISSTVYGNDT